jgi:hypothetical protein
MPLISHRTPRIRWDERGEGTPLLLVTGHRSGTVAADRSVLQHRP